MESNRLLHTSETGSKPLVLGVAAIGAVCAGILLVMSNSATQLYSSPVVTTSRPVISTLSGVAQTPYVQHSHSQASYPQAAYVPSAQTSEQTFGMEQPGQFSPSVSYLGALMMVPVALLASFKFFTNRTSANVEPIQDMASTGNEWAMAVATSAKPPRELNRMKEHQIQIIKDMSQWAADNLLKMALDPKKNWQPQDLLPDPESPDFEEQVAELRKRSMALPDDYLVVLAGDMITEEALPTYMTMLNTLEGTRDISGADDSPWAVWTRKWTAEENRHGDLLNKYMYLTGRVDMKSIEGTIQRLIGTGMNPQTDNNPYLGFIYTSFQERATKISHGNTARMAKEAGDEQLGKICGLIAADESRHEQAYTRIVEELFRRDPDGTMLAFQDMMQKQITMPAHLMDDGFHNESNNGRNLFADFAAVAEKLGVYTAEDYTDILEHLINRWKIAEFTGLSEEAQAAQKYLLALPARFRKLSARVAARRKAIGTAKFSWISNRPVEI